MQRQRGKVRNPGGKPFGFIGAADARKATIRLDLYAYHDSPPRHHTGYAPPIPILSHQSHAECFTFLGRPGLLTSKRIQVKKAFLRPTWAQEFEGWPINGFSDHPKAASQRRIGPRAVKT